MAIDYKNVKKLNLEETVQQLVYDVAEHRQITAILADLGINVLGSVESESVLDTVPTEGLIYGDAYLVGTSEPYNLHVWTRANPALGHDTAYWLNIGPITVQGPAGKDGVSIINASVNKEGYITFNLSNGSKFTLDNTVIGPEGKNGKDGGSPTIRAERTSNGVTITTYSPSGDIVSQAKVNDGRNGQSIEGPAGPAGSFNLLGKYSDQSLIPPISSVVNGDAALVYNSVRDGYDIWVVADNDWINLGAPGAGTTIYVNGQIQTDWNADTKLDKITSTGVYGRDRIYSIKSDGSQQILTSDIQPNALTIPKRTSAGNILVALNPVNANDAASKQYVDSKTSGGSASTYITSFTGDTASYLLDPSHNHFVTIGLESSTDPYPIIFTTPIYLPMFDPYFSTLSTYNTICTDNFTAMNYPDSVLPPTTPLDYGILKLEYDTTGTISISFNTNDPYFAGISTVYIIDQSV